MTWPTRFHTPNTTASSFLNLCIVRLSIWSNYSRYGTYFRFLTHTYSRSIIVSYSLLGLWIKAWRPHIYLGSNSAFP
jgi:hypothetical protein